MVVFDIILNEENLAAKDKRIGVNQKYLDTATAYAKANPQMQGAKFITSLTDPDYNRKGKTKDGKKKGAEGVGDDSKETTISFGDSKTTVSRYNKDLLRKKEERTDSDKPFGMLVGDIKRKMDSVANTTKNSISKVAKIPKVPTVKAVPSNNVQTDLNAKPKVPKINA